MTPVLSERLLSVLGWRSCWAAYFIMAVIAALAVLTFMQERPENVGEVIDGHAWTQAHPAPTAEREEAPASAQGASGRYRVFAFAVMCLIYIGNKGIFSGFTSYLAIYAVNCGFPLVQATALLSLFNLSGLAGRFGAGALDRIPLPGHIVNALLHLLMAIGAGMMIAPIPQLLWVGTFLFGFFFGAPYTLLPLLVPPYFGDKQFMRFYGIFNVVGYLGSTLAPIAVLVISQPAGGYQMSYLFIAAVSALTMLLAIICPIPKP